MRIKLTKILQPDMLPVFKQLAEFQGAYIRSVDTEGFAVNKLTLNRVCPLELGTFQMCFGSDALMFFSCNPLWTVYPAAAKDYPEEEANQIRQMLRVEFCLETVLV